MASITTALAIHFLAVLVLMLGLWPVTVARRNASLVDRFWGLGFVLIAWIGCYLGSGFAIRKLLVTVLTTLWGLRLAVHITHRGWGQGEDPRYRKMREAHGERFAMVSLFTVFGLQAVLLWIVSLPVQWTLLHPLPQQLTGCDWLGSLIVGLGLVLEAVADYQLTRFKADPDHRGQVMDRGLWAFSRHPNYFGETLVWWGFFTIALATPWGAWTIVGPILITFLLLRVSGVTLLERTLVETRPRYRDYVARTSAFIPWFPKPRKDRSPSARDA